jgi:hypothetical protein
MDVKPGEYTMRRIAAAGWMGMCLVATACAGAAPGTAGTAAPGTVEATAAPGLPPEQQQFWNNLLSLCGGAYPGEVLEAPPGDTTFAGHELVMHVRHCGLDEIHIPFHVGEDRSRTWVLTRTGSGLRLKHDHRHRDGTEDEITQYGGDTAMRGTASRQEFPADAHTAALIPAARTNVWTVEVIPDEAFVYALRREGTDRRFRIRFDLTRPVPPPPAPWGHT